MNIRSVAMGAAVGTAAGFVTYAFSSLGGKKRRDIRKNAGKALKAAGCVLDDITSAIM